MFLRGGGNPSYICHKASMGDEGNWPNYTVNLLRSVANECKSVLYFNEIFFIFLRKGQRKIAVHEMKKINHETSAYTRIRMLLRKSPNNLRVLVKCFNL
jgi:hypothetical protein